MFVFEKAEKTRKHFFWSERSPESHSSPSTRGRQWALTPVCLLPIKPRGRIHSQHRANTSRLLCVGAGKDGCRSNESPTQVTKERITLLFFNSPTDLSVSVRKWTEWRSQTRGATWWRRRRPRTRIWAPWAWRPESCCPSMAGPCCSCLCWATSSSSTWASGDPGRAPAAQPHKLHKMLL